MVLKEISVIFFQAYSCIVIQHKSKAVLANKWLVVQCFLENVGMKTRRNIMQLKNICSDQLIGQIKDKIFQNHKTSVLCSGYIILKLYDFGQIFVRK